MVSIFHDFLCLADTAFVVQGLDGGEITSTDAFGCSHNPPHCLVVELSATTIPGSEAASQDVLCGASVEGS